MDYTPGTPLHLLGASLKLAALVHIVAISGCAGRAKNAHVEELFLSDIPRRASHCLQFPVSPLRPWHCCRAQLSGSIHSFLHKKQHLDLSCFTKLQQAHALTALQSLWPHAIFQGSATTKRQTAPLFLMAVCSYMSQTLALISI